MIILWYGTTPRYQVDTRYYLVVVVPYGTSTTVPYQVAIYVVSMPQKKAY